MDIPAILTTLTDKLSAWLDTFVAMLPNLVVATLVVFAFWFVARLASRLSRRALSRVSHNQQVVRLLGSGVRVAVLVGGLFVALGVLNLEKTVTSLLAGVGIVGLALGFAFQDIAANFVSGVLLAVRRPFRLGDLVKTNDFLGHVARTDLRSTVVQLLDGPEVVIPNKDVYQNPIINYTHAGRRRVDVACGTGYGEDLDTARRVAVEAIEPVAQEFGDGKVNLFFTEFGGSSIDFVVRFWLDVSKQKSWFDARSQAIVALKTAYDQHGIDIPYPIRTLDLGVDDQPRLLRRLSSPSAEAASPVEEDQATAEAA